MMRDILFRGKQNNGEWVEGYYCGKVNKTIFSPAEDSAQIIDDDLYWHEVIPETVGQYTGLTDDTKWEHLTKEEQSDWLKTHTVDEWDGKKIFEGDIVQTWDGLKGMIVFGDFTDSEGCNACACQGWFWKNLDEKDTDLNYIALSDEWAQEVILGNIHDNPELLGGEDNGT